MNHFIISYAGNKRKEYDNFKENIKLDNIKNIIEPFCGSSAISFNIWKEYGNNFNYYLNDNDDKLIEIYKLLKTETVETIEKEINVIKDSVKNKEDYLAIYKKKNPTIYEYIYYNRYFKIRAGLFNEDRCSTKSPFRLNKLQLEFIDFIKNDNVFISNCDWFDVFEKFKNDENSLFMIDPPYMLSCNTFYKNGSSNIYEYLYFNPIDIFKSRIYLMLENIWLIKLLFNKYILNEYSKTYGLSKKNTTHLIIGNV